MKKILAGLFALAMIVTIATTSFAAGEQRSISVSVNDGKPITKGNTYASGTTKEMNIDDIVKEQLRGGNHQLALRLRASSAPVDYWLVIEGPEYLIENYNIRVVSNVENGEFNDLTGSPDNIIKRTYHLGVQEDANKTFTPIVTTATSLADLDGISWKLKFTDNEKNFEKVVTTTSSPIVATDEPNTDPTETPNVMVTAKPQSTNVPQATATPVPEKTINISVTNKSTSDKGDVVKTGTYKMIGSGHAVVTDADNKEKISFDLTKDVDKAKALTLNEGDKIVVTGDKDAYVQFKNGTTPTATPKVTAKPTATPKVTAKPTATPAPKTNPKTGDSTPIAGISIVAILALGVIAYTTISSRKKSK